MSNPTPQKYVDMAQEILKPFVLAVYPVEKMPNGIIMTVALALQTSHDEGVREEREAIADMVLAHQEGWLRGIGISNPSEEFNMSEWIEYVTHKCGERHQTTHGSTRFLTSFGRICQKCGERISSADLSRPFLSRYVFTGKLWNPFSWGSFKEEIK